MRHKVVFEIEGEVRETTFNGYDEEEKAKMFRAEYIQRGYSNVRIETY